MPSTVERQFSARWTVRSRIVWLSALAAYAVLTVAFTWPLAAHLLTVGEETGRLDSMFARMADIYEADTRSAIKRFT